MSGQPAPGPDAGDARSGRRVRPTGRPGRGGGRRRPGNPERKAPGAGAGALSVNRRCGLARSGVSGNPHLRDWSSCSTNRETRGGAGESGKASPQVDERSAIRHETWTCCAGCRITPSANPTCCKDESLDSGRSHRRTRCRRKGLCQKGLRGARGFTRSRSPPDSKSQDPRWRSKGRHTMRRSTAACHRGTSVMRDGDQPVRQGPSPGCRSTSTSPICRWPIEDVRSTPSRLRCDGAHRVAPQAARQSRCLPRCLLGIRTVPVANRRTWRQLARRDGGRTP